MPNSLHRRRHPPSSAAAAAAATSCCPIVSGIGDDGDDAVLHSGPPATAASKALTIALSQNLNASSSPRSSSRSAAAAFRTRTQMFASPCSAHLRLSSRPRTRPSGPAWWTLPCRCERTAARCASAAALGDDSAGIRARIAWGARCSHTHSSAGKDSRGLSSLVLLMPWQSHAVVGPSLRLDLERRCEHTP